MNRSVNIGIICILMIGTMLCLISCKKKPTTPVLTTSNVAVISQTTASTGGNVTGDGGAEVISRGVCWHTSVNPTVANSKTSDGTGTGSFTSNLTQLSPNSMYYVRAYATNSAGTSYGNQVSFTTDLAIGLSYQGGIIAYILQPGDLGYIAGEIHGLIAAPGDQSITDPWWNGSFVTTGAISTSDGSANTTAIITAQGDSGTYAARLCRNYRGGGYSDWFLPSKDQLNILFNKKAIIGNFTEQIYWSSTEYGEGEPWVQDFETGEQHLDNSSDGANVHTRAVRSF